jgi:hypothetical protein
MIGRRAAVIAGRPDMSARRGLFSRTPAVERSGRSASASSHLEACPAGAPHRVRGASP